MTGPHHFTQIKYQAVIGQDLSYSLRVTFEGKRSKDGHLIVPLVIVGAPGRQQSLQLSAHDCHQNKPLASPEISLHPNNVDKVYCRVSLPNIGEGERFCVRLEGHIPNLMFRENDYDAIGLARFSGGLDKFQYELQCELQPIEPRCFAMYRSGPRLLECKVTEERSPTDRAVFTIRPQINRVEDLGLGLLCHYRKLVDPPR